MDSQNLHLSSNQNSPANQRRSQSYQTIPKPLKFDQAMSDFKTMFPEIESDVIEAVLRANNGAVQITIDQLLILQETTIKQTSNYSFEFSLPVLPSYEASEKKLEEPPPAYTDIGKKNPTLFGFSAHNLNKVFTENKILSKRKCSWNASIIGKLPEDFLRLNTNNSGVNIAASINLDSKLKEMSETNDDFMSEEELERFLEDEKLAMFLQNEEFIRELRRNKDFLISLEADHKIVNGDSSTAISSLPVTSGGARSRTIPSTYDDAVFKHKLKHMGKSTRKKFSKMARKFSRGKSDISGLLGGSESTFNLLENEDIEKKDNGLGYN